MSVAAAAISTTPLSNQWAALLGTLIVAAFTGASGLAVWWNRRVVRRLTQQQAELANAQSGKVHVEAADLATQTITRLLREVEATAAVARKRAEEAERLVRRLRAWARDVELLMRSHGIDMPPLPDWEDIVETERSGGK